MKKFIIISLVLILVFVTSLVCYEYNRSNYIFSSSIIENDYPTLIIDAGHGGLDSGTIAKDGTQEKDINLSISKKLRTFLLSSGFKVVMTRTNEELIGDNNLRTIRERKVSDVKKRLEIINKTENSVLISIHQNYFTSSEYYGVQVFYSKNHSDSINIAKSVQNSAVSLLQKENKRSIKPCGSEIWLMHNCQRPAIMVECGFMSNYNELCNLKDDNYQNKIAFMISIGILNYYTNS